MTIAEMMVKNGLGDIAIPADVAGMQWEANSVETERLVLGILRRKAEERKRKAGDTLADRNEEKYADVPRIRTRFSILVYANMD